MVGKYNTAAGHMDQQISYYSRDLENWEVYREDGGIPLQNKSGHIVMSQNGRRVFKGTQLHEWESGQAMLCDTDGNPTRRIAYEPMRLGSTMVLEDYFIAIPESRDEAAMGKFAVSKDGVYYTMLDIPDVKYNRNGIATQLYRVFLLTDGRIAFNTLGQDAESGYWISEYLVCSIEELDAAIQESDVYVQVNDVVLGFSVPPVTEDDRTLVPMRFLFEQLGAEVSWDETTNTATATIPPEKDEKLRTAANAKSVSFSIDNTAATVNGVAAAMDVPARLVDDKTMVPLRFLSKNLGYTVTWNEANNTAVISK